MIKIAPSILSADFANLQRDIELVEEAGADWLHIDVMDGHFVPNITIGAPVVKSLRKISKLPFDVHLMIENPENYIKSFAESGADIITVHIEATRHLHRVIQLIKSEGKKAGIALNPGTPINTLEYILQEVDMVLLMSVNPGFGGQKFIEKTCDKLADLKNMAIKLGCSVDIQVDGGIKVENIEKVKNCGANIFVAGSSIYNSGSISDTILKMRESCK